MSIYEREYTQASRSGRRGAGLLDRYTSTQVLIGINIVCFILGMVGSLRPFMHENFVVGPVQVLNEHRIHTLVTYAFFHVYLWHILFNMWSLAFFSDHVENIYGRGNTAFLYLLGALASGVAEVGYQQALGMPNGAAGASGAIHAIAIVCACLDPDREVRAFFIIPMKMKWAAVLFIAIDLLGATSMGQSPVAHAAHLGGAALGFVFYKLDLRVFRGEGRSVSGGAGFMARLGSLFRRKPKLRIVERSGPAREREEPPSRTSVDARTAERVDMLLKKISEEGIGALTDEERAFLKASSEKYRK